VRRKDDEFLRLAVKSQNSNFILYFQDTLADETLIRTESAARVFHQLPCRSNSCKH